MKKHAFIAFLFLFGVLMVQAQIELPSVFGDNMVLQQRQKVSIWGKDVPNTSIVITSSWGHTASTISDSKGFWSTTIKTKKGSFAPQNITITGSNSKTLKNILIGEVWFCSGQSNMEMPLKGLGKSKVLKADNYLKNANNKNIRLFNNARTASISPSFNVNGEWVESDAISANTFSAIGYMFGAKLFEKLNVPIGIIESAWGGTRIESWIPKEDLLKYKGVKFSNTLPKEQKKQKKPSFLYNAMIHPFKDFTVRGILWYQGESNRSNPESYNSCMKDLIASWRTQWNNKNLPFYFVQIAPFNYVKNKNGTKKGADLIREAQFKISQNIPNTGIVITTDAGDCNDIHPSKKEIIAKRLLKMALANQYNVKGLNYESATLKKMSIKNDKVTLRFTFQKGDFFIKADNISGFSLASNDKVFHPAKVSFDEDKKTLTIYGKKVNNPVALRYGFEDCFESNLKTNSGLPISVFRTDNW